MTDQLKLVERFDELREGMEVVEIACPMHGITHRWKLVKFLGQCELDRRDGKDFVADFFLAFSDTCDGDGISSRTVSDRRVFRVVDGTDDAQTTKVAAPKTLERVR